MRSPRTASRHRATPDAGAKIFWWYLFLLIPTVGLKFLSLKEIYRSGFYTVARSLGDSDHPAVHAWYGALVFGGDLLEIGLFVGAVFLVAHVLLGVSTSPFIVVGTLGAMLFGAANTISCYELSQYLTFDSLSISFHWIKENPDVLRSWFSWPILMLVPLTIGWSFGPILMHRFAKATRAGASFQTFVFRGAISFALVLVLSQWWVSWTQGFAPTPATRGYWSASLASLLFPTENPLLGTPHPAERVVADFRDLVYPETKARDAGPLFRIPNAARKPRHIVIVSLETAPRPYYPIIDNPELPNFYQMSQHAIVSDMHYSNSPFTHWANYGMLSGLYPRIAPSIVKLGDFRAHGLANILAPRGYEATFIDSWRLSWSPGDEQRRLLKNLGFGNLVELTPVENHWADDEADAFEHARERLLEAQHQGKRALIFMDTMVGHYPWRQDERLSARENMYTILEDFDALFGSFLAFLEEQGLEEHVLLMITGDHGLRFREEYVSLREERSLGLAFNVPFMLYAPGLLESSVRVPYASSHVDITPTLLDLVGSGDDEMVHHGESILERRIAHRITFFWNTSLSPVDGFHWKRLFFSYNNLTGRAQVARRADQGDAVSLRNALDAHSEIPVVLHDPKGLLQAATHLLDQTAAYQLRIEK